MISDKIENFVGKKIERCKCIEEDGQCKNSLIVKL